MAREGRNPEVEEESEEGTEASDKGTDWEAFGRTYSLDEREIREIIAVEDWKRKIDAGEEVPDEIRESIDVMNKIKVDEVFAPVKDGERIHRHLFSTIPGIKKLIIVTEEAQVEILFNPPDGTAGLVGWPLDETGEKVDALLYMRKHHPRKHDPDIEGILM